MKLADLAKVMKLSADWKSISLLFHCQHCNPVILNKDIFLRSGRPTVDKGFTELLAGMPHFPHLQLIVELLNPPLSTFTEYAVLQFGRDPTCVIVQGKVIEKAS